MTDTMEPETRVYPRKPFSGAAKVAVGEKAPLEGRGVDISAGGICLLLPEPVSFGEFCVVKFELELDGNTRQFSGVAKSVYSVRDGVNAFRSGFQFFRLDAASTDLLTEFMNRQS